MSVTQALQPRDDWDAELIRREGEPGSLVYAAQQSLLLHRDGARYRPIELTWVDLAALALVGAAMRRGRSIGLLYPVAAGEVPGLLAAQVAAQLFFEGCHHPLVGLVTADPLGVCRSLKELAVKERAGVVPLLDVFPCLRAAPDGTPPPLPHHGRGIIVGRRRRGWAVHVTIFDHLKGAVEIPAQPEPTQLEVHLFSNPLDEAVSRWEAAGRFLWGWPHGLLRSSMIRGRPPDTAAPFSPVAYARLRTLAKGSRVLIRPLSQPQVEAAFQRVLDDLRTLGHESGPAPSPHVLAGIRRAWGFAYTLMSLPCKPSAYDRLCGRPPLVASPTGGFAGEIVAWAKTLSGRSVESALVLADDIRELRGELDNWNPLLDHIKEAIEERDTPTLVVVRSRTARDALLSVLGMDEDQAAARGLTVAWYRSLYKVGPHRKAVVVGVPPRSMWHLVDSGLAEETVVLAMGNSQATWAVQTLGLLRERRARTASGEVRGRVWRELFRCEPPAAPSAGLEEAPDIETLRIAPPPVDPFEPIRELLLDDRPLIEEDGFEPVARTDRCGRLSGIVQAVEVETDRGLLLLPDQEVDVLAGGRLSGLEVRELRPGMLIVLGRWPGRLRLLDALTERLDERPDLRAARLLVEDFRERLRGRFQQVERGFLDQGLSDEEARLLALDELCRRVRAAGSDKTSGAIRKWVDPEGPMGPRDLEDIRCLVQALGLGFDTRRTLEVHRSLERIRGLRRALGRRLVEAAYRAVVAEDSFEDAETGLSVADLREAVVVATVTAVRGTRLARATEIGRLLEVG